jgi:aminodeoxyfutalosine synthase
MAGGRSPQGFQAPEICNVIWAAGRVPVERDSLYNEVKIYPREQALSTCVA